MVIPNPLSLVGSKPHDAELPITSIIAAAQVHQTFLRAGQDTPFFSLLDTHGKAHALAKLLENGPVVISFQRGDWCSYSVESVKALKAIQEGISMLSALLIIVVPASANSSDSKQFAGVLTLIDPRLKVSASFGLTYDVPQELRQEYLRLGFSPQRPGLKEWRIPAPATYVIDRFGKIALAFLNLDYRHPMKVDALLSVVRGLSKE